MVILHYENFTIFHESSDTRVASKRKIKRTSCSGITSTGSIPSLRIGEFRPTRRALPPYTTSPPQNRRRIHRARAPRAYFSVHTIIVGGSADAIEYEPVRSPRGKSLLFFPSSTSTSSSSIARSPPPRGAALLTSMLASPLRIYHSFFSLERSLESLPLRPPGIAHPEISSALADFLRHAPLDMSVATRRGNLLSFRTNSG